MRTGGADDVFLASAASVTPIDTVVPEITDPKDGATGVSIGSVPLSNQAVDKSGIAAKIRCTTSKLGLLRPDRIWLTIGRATLIASANWVGESRLNSSSFRMRSTMWICLFTNVAMFGESTQLFLDKLM